MKKLWQSIVGWLALDPDDEYLDDATGVMEYVAPGQTINKGDGAAENATEQQKR